MCIYIKNKLINCEVFGVCFNIILTVIICRVELQSVILQNGDNKTTERFNISLTKQ